MHIDMQHVYIKIKMCNNNNYYNFIYLGWHITVKSW